MHAYRIVGVFVLLASSAVGGLVGCDAYECSLSDPGGAACDAPIFCSDSNAAEGSECMSDDGSCIGTCRSSGTSSLVCSCADGGH